MSLAALCRRYLYAESEDEVTAIVDCTSSSHELKWCPLDGRVTNFNVVTNQAATGGKALTELCTNMVDAIILRCAEEAGIEPLASSAPRSVVHAVRDLVRLPGALSGILAEVDDHTNLREYAESNLVIGVTGEKGSDARPCFTFVDSGEGQHPEKFEATFLSLSSGLKSKIPFVQGKYNMGSSGVLSFCGRRWYKLIVSRRYDRSGHWGWTLLRRRPAEGPPVAEYLKIDDQIPAFDAKSLFPLRRADGKPDRKVERDSGTIIKLYSYNLGRPADFRRIREALNEGLISTILPFRLMDYRVRPRPRRRDRRAQGIDERTISGMEYQIRQAKKDAGASDPSSRIHVADLQHPDLGKVNIWALSLPDTLPSWLALRTNRSRVYHAVNGQVQYRQSRAYVSQCGLSGLKDRVVVLVDASNLKESAHNDIWKGDRETIRGTEIGNLYDREVRQAITGSETLKNLEKQIRQQELEDYQQKTQVDLFESIVATDMHIAQLLPGGELIRIPGHRAPRDVKKVVKYQGKYSPSYIKHVSRKLSQEGIEIVVGERRRVRFETDAVNDWLTRPDNRGSIVLEGTAGQGLAITSALRDGSLTVTVHSVGTDIVSGTVLSGAVALKDSAMPIAVEESVRFRVVSQRATKKPGGPNEKQKKNCETPGDMVSKKGLPRTEWLTKDGRRLEDEKTRPWPGGYSEHDGGFVKTLGDEECIYMINYDNAHFQTFLRKERSKSEKRVITEQYRLGMLVMMLSFEDSYLRSSDRNRLAEVIDEYRRVAARAAATVVMSITRTLPNMVTSKRLEDLDDE